MPKAITSNGRKRVLGGFLLFVDLTAEFHIPRREIGASAECHRNRIARTDDEGIELHQFFSASWSGVSPRVLAFSLIKYDAFRPLI